ncbi:hypothetical protein ONR75_18210 [Rhodopseudomonas sp. P2A-2r]|uniref:hypothetical protein n=1 Tax=Rhodopseudomonas sp. P2A-2r TaxID=2991972 RepID=UPI002233EE11|nr:hypothetical protein [Rhodopseudomonas sp. P2A-2r]UZE46946.1 hypothetical protein ONR75_18210 [Rhodopseudomonas sp. P2A-2r]
MSCVNATCASLKQEQPPVSIPNLSLHWRLFVRHLADISWYFARRFRRREILELDDRLLADIDQSLQEVADDALEAYRTRSTMWLVHG